MMNRRRFFSSPMALLPVGAAVPVNAAGGPVVINLAVTNSITGDFVENNPVPLLRAAINDGDIILIDPRSRQAELLR